MEMKEKKYPKQEEEQHQDFVSDGNAACTFDAVIEVGNVVPTVAGPSSLDEINRRLDLAESEVEQGLTSETEEFEKVCWQLIRNYAH